MCQLEVVVTSLIGNINSMFSQSATGLLIAHRAFYFARELTVQLAGLADTLREKLWAGGRSAFVVHEKGFEAKVKSAAFTRAGFGNSHLLKNSEHKPQPAHTVTLDGQGFHLTAHLTMFHELEQCPINLDGVTAHHIARLREGERGIFLSFSEPRATFHQSLEKPHVGIIDAQAYILTAW